MKTNNSAKNKPTITIEKNAETVTKMNNTFPATTHEALAERPYTPLWPEGKCIIL